MPTGENRHGADEELTASAEPPAPDAAGAEGGPLLILDTGDLADSDPGETVVLDLGDLLPDASGEVVLFADDALPVNIVTDQPVTDAGIAETHVTATGVDVTGLHFYSFEGGVTVYSPTDVLIIADSGVT